MSTGNLLELNWSAQNTLEVKLLDQWTLQGEAVSWASFVDQLKTAATPVEKISLNCDDLKAWDSRLLTFLCNLDLYTREHSIDLNTDSLPEGAKSLFKLSQAVPGRQGAARSDTRSSLLKQLGEWALGIAEEGRVFTRFVGEWLLAFGRFLLGKASFRWIDFFRFLQSAGADALPIVSLISILVGAVLAFVGAVQLQMFGAEIYVANLVALGIVREMGAMMTAIIMAGRTGSAYAAQLGTMQVNEEIDALKTLGISAMEFLVLPRSLALILMLPLLCIWSNVLGILGGFVVGVTLLDLSVLEYLIQTQESITLMDVAVGLIKSLVFAAVIAFSGCLRGLQSGRNSSAVGSATTSAMVTAILLIVIWDALTTLLFNRLGV